MTQRIFIFLTTTSFMLAPLATQLPDLELGKLDLTEALYWSARSMEEGCEGNYTMEEAVETCRAINEECNLARTEIQIENCKAGLYQDVIRFVNAKTKRAAGIAINHLNLGENFDNHTGKLVQEIQEVVENGGIEDQNLIDSLNEASQLLANLPFGNESLHEGAPTADEAIATANKLANLAIDQTQLASIVAGVSVELEAYAATQSSLLMGLPPAAQTIIPHVTQEEGRFRTDFLLTNPSGDARDFTLRAYSQAGEMLEVQTGEVPARETLTFTPSELFNSQGISHVVIQETKGIDVAVSYQAKVSGCPVLFLASDEAETAWRMVPGNWDKVWDGLAIVNQGSGAANIQIRQINNKGVVVQSMDLETLQELAPMAKATVILNDLGFSLDPQNQFQIRSNQNLSVLSLQGLLNEPFNFMWENSVIAD